MVQLIGYTAQGVIHSFEAEEGNKACAGADPEILKERV